MTHAEAFRQHLIQKINGAGAKVVIKVGIITMTFPDGSVLDFTEPLEKQRSG